MFPRKPIKKVYTLSGYLGNAVWLMVPFVIFSDKFLFSAFENSPLSQDLLYLFGIPAALVLTFWLFRHNRANEHKLLLAKFAATAGYQALPDVRIQHPYFNKMSLAQLRNTSNDQLQDAYRGPDWVYGEYSYDIMRATKYGTYKAATVYYGVMATELPRELPNVFFDSKEARGRQFKLHFAAKQRHSLEGDFDNFFDTYFPPGYTIDSMSFISPDVMIALRNASDYDIEIAGNKLLLYGTLISPSQLLPDMAAHLTDIKSQLLDNIVTYRDERMPYGQGRQRVTPLGATLQRSTFWRNFSIGVLILYILFEVVRGLVASYR